MLRISNIFTLIQIVQEISKKSILLLFLLLSILGFAQIPEDIEQVTTKAIYVSINNGNWTEHSNWAGDVSPDYNQTSNQDAIFISSNITLGFDMDVKSGTVLQVTATDTLSILGDVMFRNGSTIYVEANGVLIITGNLTNNNNSDQVVIDGELILDGDFYGGNGSSVEGDGQLEITGSVTTDGTGTVFGSTDDCDGTLGDCSRDASGLLPVELISFDLKEIDGTVELFWTTASELNNDYFTIEKSFDLIEFEKIASVDGAGNSNYINEYFYSDKLLVSGTTYYRLKQTDFDGTVSILGIISVESARIDRVNQIEIYPNPVSHDLGVCFEKLYEETAILTLVSDDGRIVYKDRLNSGFEVNIKIPMQDLSAGVYFLQVEIRNEIISKRVVKL